MPCLTSRYRTVLIPYSGKQEYTGNNADWISVFKAVLVLQNCTQEQTLAGMTTKRIISKADFVITEYTASRKSQK